MWTRCHLLMFIYDYERYYFGSGIQESRVAFRNSSEREIAGRRRGVAFRNSSEVNV